MDDGRLDLAPLLLRGSVQAPLRKGAMNASHFDER